MACESVQEASNCNRSLKRCLSSNTRPSYSDCPIGWNWLLMKMRGSGSSLRRVLMLYRFRPSGPGIGRGRLVFQSAGSLRCLLYRYVALTDMFLVSSRSTVTWAWCARGVGRFGSAVVIVCGGNALSGIGEGLVQTTLPHPAGGGVFGRAPG